MNTPSFDQVKEMDRKIDLLRNRANESTKEANQAFKTQLRAAEDHLNLVKARMEKVGAQAEGATEEMKKGLQEAWDQLNRSVSEASKKLH